MEKQNNSIEMQKIHTINHTSRFIRFLKVRATNQKKDFKNNGKNQQWENEPWNDNWPNIWKNDWSNWHAYI